MFATQMGLVYSANRAKNCGIMTSKEIATMTTIRIVAGEVSMLANLNDSLTARKLWTVLPVEGTVNTWGDEVYFEVPVIAELDPYARVEVDVGELGYWPVGHAFCIFFGPTPVSPDGRPRAASPVNILGRLKGDATQFGLVSAGTLVSVTRTNQS